MLRRSAWNEARNIILMIAGIASAAFGLESFLIPTGFIDGGVTGISLLTRHEIEISLSVLIIAINFPFIILGWRQIGTIFGIKSILAISLLAVALAFVHFPIVANDKLLVAVFWRIFFRRQYRAHYPGRWCH